MDLAVTQGDKILIIGRGILGRRNHVVVRKTA
jgi:hypothetical protein